MRNPAGVELSPRRWSTRLCLLSLAGILLLTLLPFHFNFHATLPGRRSPFLLAGWGKQSGVLDAFLNILLFVPFGFAISDMFRLRRKTKTRTLVGAFVLGLSLSYGIEFLQIYVPGRDSGWEDTITNTAGAVVGFLFHGVCGAAVVRFLCGGESLLARLLIWPKFAWLIPLYLACWLALSVPLQQQTRLDNWDRFPLLAVGGDPSSGYGAAWEGEVYSLQLWDRPLGAARVDKLTTSGNLRLDQAGLLTAYNFSAALPLNDQMNFVPKLAPVSPWGAGRFRESPSEPGTFLDGHDWLTSGAPVTNLVLALQKTNQFTIRVVCRPERLSGTPAAIVLLSARSGIADLEVAQQNADLHFSFRNSINPTRPSLEWVITNVFTARRIRDLVFSYDGSTARLFLDGQPASFPYRLGPGPALARYFRRIKSTELDGYTGVYYALIFFIGGILAGLALRSCHRRNMAGVSLLAFSLTVPALLLEAILAFVSGKAFSWADVALSIGLMLGGVIWINADKSPATPQPR